MNLLKISIVLTLFLIFISCSDSKNNNAGGTGQAGTNAAYNRDKCVVEGRKKVMLCVPQYRDIIEKNKVKKIVECKDGKWNDLTSCYETYLEKRRERKEVDGIYGLNYNYDYDEDMILQGYIIESGGGDKIRDVIYEYNEYRDILQITEKRNNKPQKVSRYESNYNASDVLIERVEYLTVYSKNEREYKNRKYTAVLFASSNRPKREIIQSYSEQGYLIQEEIYYYNEFGEVTEFTMADTLKIVRGKKDFSKSQEVVELFNRKNELLYKEVATFNNEGDDLSIIVTNALDERVYEWEMVSNTIEQKEWIQYDNKGNAIGSIKAKLDADGNQVEIYGKEKYINNDMKIVNLDYSKAYEYDDKGFMIMKSEPPVDIFDYRFKLFDYIYIER